MSKKAVLNTQIFKVTELFPADYNPRKDLQKDDLEYKQLKKSIKEFDYVDPLIFNRKTNTLISGHQRLNVLKDLGYTDIEVNCVDLDPTKEKALNIALNKIKGDWNEVKLKDLLDGLIQDSALDINITGFTDFEVDSLVKEPFDFVQLTDSIEQGIFAKTVDLLSEVFNVTFSFPADSKTFIQSKLKENGKEFYTSKILEVFNA